MFIKIADNIINLSQVTHVKYSAPSEGFESSSGDGFFIGGMPPMGAFYTVYFGKGDSLRLDGPCLQEAEQHFSRLLAE